MNWRTLDKKAKEELYARASDCYYDGKPVLTDGEFDLLRDDLKLNGSSIINTVGGGNNNNGKLKHKHASPMLSLDKVQVNDAENDFPMAEIEAWIGNRYPIEATPKFDGNAIELLYDKHCLTWALTRGRDGKGSDVLSKLRLIVPENIPGNGRYEIRGEVLMTNEVFNKKYSHMSLSRSVAAGILNSDDGNIQDCCFVAYSFKEHTGNTYSYGTDTQGTLTNLGFNTRRPVKQFIIKSKADIKPMYDEFLKYRSIAEFPLDGIVLKMSENIRSSVGYSSHHPKWALAIKFPSAEAMTTIKDIEWNVGYTGELAPTAILESVLLDGSNVSRVSVYNKTKIEAMGVFPGAVVSIKKSGDIIPKIIEVLVRSPREQEFINKKNYYPTNCPSCNSKLEFEQDSITEHIMCKNTDCPSQVVKKLANGIEALEIKGIGEGKALMLVESGITSIFDFFNPNKMNEAFLSKGQFKRGRELDLVLECPKKITEVDLDRVILSLQFLNLGKSGSLEAAKILTSNKPILNNTKKVLDQFMDAGNGSVLMVRSLVTLLQANGIKVNGPKDTTGTMGVEMTGSPDGSGYKTKDELLKFLATKGYAHTGLKDAKILLTDSHTSSSSKMAAARKKGIQIMTYQELIASL